MNERIANEVSRPNLKYVVDGEGRGWFCDGEVPQGADPRHEACTPAEDVIYDRMFGG